MSAKAQLQYNKKLGCSRRGRNRGVREAQKEEVQEAVREEVEEEVRGEVRDGSESEESDGVRMVHVLNEKLDEVWSGQT